MNTSKSFTLFLSIGTVALALVNSASAQAPSAQDMIEQLKAKPAPVVAPSAVPGAGRTRSLGGTRNLNVDAANPTEMAATGPASTSQAMTSATTPVAVPERASLSLLIQFDFNSARVKTESSQALANLATALQSKELLAAKFAIEGHTDSKGGADYNQRLSQQRADAVRDFLVGKGIDSTRLSSAGKGASDPANKNDPLAAENRRVKIVNLQ